MISVPYSKEFFDTCSKLLEISLDTNNGVNLKFTQEESDLLNSVKNATNDSWPMNLSGVTIFSICSKCIDTNNVIFNSKHANSIFDSFANILQPYANPMDGNFPSPIPSPMSQPIAPKKPKKPSTPRTPKPKKEYKIFEDLADGTPEYLKDVNNLLIKLVKDKYSDLIEENKTLKERISKIESVLGKNLEK